uniref:Charged multivesicular body protein 3 n=1 Tax=Alexandrium catenella TaxID=2925 RepID=A0A7S1RIR0_ALECA
MSAPQSMRLGSNSPFHFSAQPSDAPPFATQPLTRTSGLELPPTQTAFSSQASLPVQERSFDIRTSETFYGDVPVTQPQNLGLPHDLRNAETFVANPAPFSSSGSSQGVRGAYPAQEAVYAPQAAQHQSALPSQEYDGYSKPSRMQGVPMGAAQGLFVPAPPAARDGTAAVIDAKVKARELQFQLKLEMKHLEREVRKLTAEEGKMHRKMRAQAERGNTYEAQLIARNVIQTRRAIGRLEKLKASMHGVVLRLTESIASMSMRSCLKLSTDVMRQMGELSQLPQLEAAVQQMRQQAASYSHTEGFIDEALRDHEVEEASGLEVQRVLEELALDRQVELLTAASPAAGSVPQSAVTVPRTVPRTVPQMTQPSVPLTRLPSTASVASTIIPPGWQQDGVVS